MSSAHAQFTLRAVKRRERYGTDLRRASGLRRSGSRRRSSTSGNAKKGRPLPLRAGSGPQKNDPHFTFGDLYTVFEPICRISIRMSGREWVCAMPIKQRGLDESPGCNCPMPSGLHMSRREAVFARAQPGIVTAPSPTTSEKQRCPPSKPPGSADPAPTHRRPTGQLGPSPAVPVVAEDLSKTVVGSGMMRINYIRGL